MFEDEIIWDVVNIDWNTDNVVDTFKGEDAEQRAKDFAERMDGLAMRCVAVRRQPGPIRYAD